ncbi:MAG: STAS domain-containing protein [Bacteroidales bacterium]|nr:STAS domain-containing protein [Bacteroidales bacterium]
MNQIFRPKFFSLYRSGIDRSQLSKDLFAGIIVGIVALPLAIAFAVASGVSPEKGLITAVVAGFLISFLGGSRVQIGGPTGAFIVVIYGIVEKYGIDGLMISTVLAGILLVLFGVLKLGTLLKYIPYPMIVGFTSGIAVIIFSTQIKDAFGLTTGAMPGDFIQKWNIYFDKFDTVNLFAFIISVSTILIVVLFKKITSKIPSSFIAIIGITLVVYLFKIPVLTIGDTFGDIPQTISFSLPNFNISEFGNYLSAAIIIALLGAIESLLSAVVADGMIGGNHRSNTELIAQGIANIASPFFGGIPATGAIARTATNVKSGGRTPIAGIVHAVVLLMIFLFLGSWAKLIPMSCLAGILIVVSVNMSEWRSFVSVLKGSGFDILILLTTFVLTVFVDLTVAIEVGIVLSALLFMKRMADVSESITNEIDSDVLETVELPKEINVYEISGPFFFASARQYSEAIRLIGAKSKILIIRMRHVPFIDGTGCKNFLAALKDLKSQKITIILSGVRPEVLKQLEKEKIEKLVGKDHIFSAFSDALDFAGQNVGNAVKEVIPKPQSF